ncbi:MAG: RNA polymerase [Thermodesulfobacteriota bacterium]|nr:MAG: RNA polymerase [Thermodesulfobacteriota bacterium]
MAKINDSNILFLDSYREKMNQDTATVATEHTDRENELKTLLSLISNGDENAMRTFYQQTVRLVYSMSHKIISNPEEAEEVALEVFMYVWNNASKYDSDLSKPLSWLLMITRSRSIDKIRKSAKTVHIDDSIDDSMVTGTDNPEDTYVASEMRKITKHAMAQLTPKQKEVVELSYYHQYSHSEIADKVGIPVGSVKSTIRVAMVKMKNIINEEQGHLYESKVH